MTHEDVVRRTAVAIRLACPSDDLCVEDEDECFAKYPIHFTAKESGVISTIMADVDGLAEFVVDLFEKGFFEDYK